MKICGEGIITKQYNYIDMSIFKKFIQIPGVQFFFVVSFISYIIKNYYPITSIYINIISIFQFSIV